VLERMRLGGTSGEASGPPLPEGTTARVDAVLVRLARHRDLDAAATYLTFALRPPQASRRIAAEDQLVATPAAGPA
jgi:hypothetical protein